MKSSLTTILSSSDMPVCRNGSGEWMRYHVRQRTVDSTQKTIGVRGVTLVMNETEAARVAMSLVGSLPVEFFVTHPDVTDRLRKLVRMVETTSVGVDVDSKE